jgi:iron complex transport system permease protein
MQLFSRLHLRARTGRGLTALFILLLLILSALLVSMNTGFIRLAPMEVLQTLLGFGTAKQELILFDLRLPRILVSILAGAGLAVSGAILQTVSRNALADPGILGINAGAGLAVILFVSYYPLKAGAPVFLLPFLAFLGAGVTACLIYSLSYKKHEGISPIRLILVGIGIAAGISAATIVLTIRLSPVNYQFVSIWLAGSMWGTTWKFVVALLPWIALLLPFTFYKSRILNVLNLGDRNALGLGIRLERERLVLLAVAVGLSASCVAVGGAIGLIGLVGPHLARRLVGSRHQLLLPASALIGGLLLIVADTVARTLIQPSEIPTGIIVTVIGAPYFLYLLATSKDS